MGKTIVLVDIRGRTSVHIDATINNAGNLVFSGQDIGEAPSEYVGDSDYEYWRTIPDKEKDSFLLALVEKMYLNDSGLITNVSELLDAKGIAYSRHSF